MYTICMPLIRINDYSLYTQLREHAKIDKRSAAAELEIILQLYFSDAEGGLTYNEVADKRKKENVMVRDHIVKEGQDLGILPKPLPLEEAFHPEIEPHYEEPLMADVEIEELGYKPTPRRLLSTVDREWTGPITKADSARKRK